MSAVAQSLLGDIADLQAGVGFPVDLQGRSSGDYPVAKVGDISRVGRSGEAVISSADHFVDEADLARLRAKPIPAGSVLFAKIGEAIRQNHRVIAGCALLVDNNAMAAIPTLKVESRYLYHFLRTIDFYALASATTVPALRKSELERLPVPLPPLPEQRRIAEILDKADALRAKRRAALAQLDTLTQSIFLDMFGDSEGNDYPLGQHAVRVTKGTTPTTVGYSFADSGVPFLRVQNLRGDQIDFAEDVLYVSEETHQAFGRSQIRPGDVLTTIAGTIGRTVVVPNNAPAANCNQAIAIITPRGSLNSLYLCHWLRSQSALQQMRQGQVTATISNLSLGQIKSLKIPVPSNVDQRRFAGRAEAINRTKGLHEAALAELNALFASLQHRAFRGEL